jgi:hypothetical protein
MGLPFQDSSPRITIGQLNVGGRWAFSAPRPASPFVSQRRPALIVRALNIIPLQSFLANRMQTFFPRSKVVRLANLADSVHTINPTQNFVS